MRPAARRLARLAPAFALVAAVLAPAFTAGTSYAADDGTGSLPVSIDVTALTPQMLTTADTLVIHGLLTNRGARRQDDLRVAVGIGARIASRSALTGADENPPAVDHVVTRAADRTTLRAGGAPSSFSVEVPVADLHLGDLGVYPLRIDARSDRGLVGSVQTYLPWFPDGVAAPTRLAWLWPLVDVPRRGAGNVLRGDGLAAEIAPGGRLRRLVDAALAAQRANPPVPVTLAVDPDLLETVSLMATTAYQVAAGSGGTVDGTGGSAARAWLAQLRAVVAGGDAVIALPYADPDAVALETADLGRLLGDAVAEGRKITAQLLPKAQLAEVAWPPDGAITTAALRTVAAHQPLSGIVLGEPALPLLETHSYTVGALAHLDVLDRPIDALVADSGLDDVVARAEEFGPGPRLAEQRFIAETALLTAERPNDSRDVLVVPPRRWDPQPGYAPAVLTAAGSLPWLRPATLGDIERGPVPDNAERARLRYPDSAADRRLPASYVDQVAGMAQGLALFDEIVVDDSVLAPVTRGIWRSASTAWRANLRAGRAVRGETADALSDLRGKVRVASGGRVITLTSFTGTVPITIANELASPVQVRVRVDARNRARLRSGASSVQTIPPHRRPTVDVTVSAPAPGEFPVYVSLATPRGDVPLGDRVMLRVNVTAYGRLALAITGAAFGVLLVAVGVRISRRALRARRARPR